MVTTQIHSRDGLGPSRDGRVFSRKRTNSSHHLLSHAWHVPVMHDHHPIMGVIGFAFFHPWHKLFCSSQFFIVNGFAFFAGGDKLFCPSRFFIVNGFTFFAEGDKLFYKTINTSHQYWFFSDSLLLISQHGILLSRNWLILLFTHDFFLLNTITLRYITRHFVPPIIRQIMFIFYFFIFSKGGGDIWGKNWLIAIVP